MNPFHNNHNGYESNGDCSHELAQSLFRATEKTYGAFINVARKHWERRFAGKDPADACVSVRVSGDQALEEHSRLREPDLDPGFPLAVHPAREELALR
jgi:hypothetical protein